MIDRLFTALLAFALLAGGAAAIGSALFAPRPALPVVHLPTVQVTGTRAASAAVAREDSRDPAAPQWR